MRYSAKRIFTHPVLRPGSDDYVNAEPVRPELKNPKPVGVYEVELEMHWHPGLRSIETKMQMGEASLMGLVYCTRTFYRSLIRPKPADPFAAIGRIDTRQIRGKVEVHPLIVAKRTLKLDPNGLNREYGDEEIEIRKGEPLAVEERFEMEFETADPKPQSFVQLLEDENATEERYVIHCEPGQPQITITMHPNEYEGLARIRKTADALAGFYLPALIKACQTIANMPWLERDDDPGSWNASIERILARGSAEGKFAPCWIARANDDYIPEVVPDMEQVQPEEAAQRLLHSPIGKMLKSHATPDEDEDGE